MNLTIQSIHFNADDKLKGYVEKKCTKLERLFDRITHIHVYLKLVKPATANNKVMEIKTGCPRQHLDSL